MKRSILHLFTMVRSDRGSQAQENYTRNSPASGLTTHQSLVMLLFAVAIGVSVNAQTTTFNFNGTTSVGNVGISGTPQTYVVPAGVTSLGVNMYGAAGGWPCCDWTSSSAGGPRSFGGRVQCTLNVTPGETLYVYVGGKGGDNYSSGTQIPGGWNGGGICGDPFGSSFAGSGGGASDIRISTSGAYASSVLVVAGGGGGGGDFGPVGGAGGGLTGGAGGGGGACGGGQTGPSCTTGVGLGTQGQGGSCVCYSAGGGGGGWWGGNGGVVNNGAGGGGSSYSHPTRCSGVTHTQGYSTANGNGLVVLSVLCSTPPAIDGSSTVCLGGTSTYTNSTSGGAWSSSDGAKVTINSSGVATGMALGTAVLSYTVSGGCFITKTVTVTAAPNVSNFTSTTATDYCSGAGSIVTIASTTIGAGTYTVTYNLSGANTSSGNTASLTMGASTGTFTIPLSLLSANGATTVTVTGVSTSGCNATVTSGNTGAFVVGRTPDISDFTSPSATNVCAGVNSTATINSTSLGAGTYTVTFTLGGASTSIGNTAVLTMGAANGTFTIPGSLLIGGGSTVLTISSIRNIYGCSVSPTMNNTALFSVSAASVPFSMTGGGSYCSGGSGMAVGISASTSGNDYQLYRDAAPVGSPVSGSGSAISFGTFTTTGTYSVIATNSSSSCTRTAQVWP